MNPANWGRLGLVLLVAMVFQVGVLDQITVLGAHPDVLVLLAAAAGLAGGAQRGAVIAFVVGLLADLVVSTPYGLSPLTFVLVGFGVGMLRSIPAGRDSLGAQAVALVAAAAIGTLAYAILGAIVGQPKMLGSQAAAAVFIVALGSILLAVPALRALEWTLAGSSQVFEAGSVPRGGSALG